MKSRAQTIICTLLGIGVFLTPPVKAQRSPGPPTQRARQSEAKKAPRQTTLVTKAIVGADYSKATDGNYEINVPPKNPEVLPVGTTAIAFEFTLDPEKASLEGFQFTGGDIATSQMEFQRKNNYAIINGQPLVSRVTGLVRRADGKAFKPGPYKFRVYVNGNRVKPEVEVPFVIK
jgi:hypothetical protein